MAHHSTDTGDAIDTRPYGQSNRGSNPTAGPNPSGYPSWYDDNDEEPPDTPVRPDFDPVTRTYR